jgi:GTP-binding protein EngB required for normal cell division
MEESREAQTHVEIHRRACDVTGKLGYLYDIKTDRFVKQNTLLREPNWYIKNTTPNCYWWWSDKSNESQVPLDKLEMEDELCLSLYLGMCGDNLNGRASLVNYEKPIDQRTIFLLYSYSTREQWLPKNSFLASTFFPNGTFDNLNVDASHILHGIMCGFEVLFVIQIPDTIEEVGDESDITCLLNKICKTLKQRPSLQVWLTDDEQNLWFKLNIHIVATSPDLSFDQTTHILSIIYRIEHFKYHWRLYEYPLAYIFQPVTWIHHTASAMVYKCIENRFSEDSKQIQRQFYLLQNTLNKLTFSLRLLQEGDKERFLLPQSTNVEEKLHRLKEKRRELFQNLRNMLLDVRHGKQDLHMLSEIIEGREYDPLRMSSIGLLIEECDSLCEKVRSIDQLRRENFEYLQITDDESSSKQQQITKLFANSIRPVYILCSSDLLIEQNEQLWNSYRQELINKRNQDSTIRLIYADLSYCKHEDIKKTTIISCNSPTNKQISSSSSSREQVPEKRDINVLLLGESGVGKSTFINAFVNYLTFDSLEQALTEEPVVLIPVSFLLTINDNFEEFIVKFGDVDANEDHHHPGQSVTQYCRSYVFDISNKLRLRLIDTPGVGDTRGLEQDSLNIDRVLSYVNNFSHINAVCILLQPNVSRLNVVFRSCIIQLFSYLTPAARDNIVFCFTNTRPTFFAPGNTAPLLKSFLKELPIKDIPFGKKNSFCFDSESFRYLAAVKNKVDFNQYQQEECHKSWANSVIESERLFKFICILKPYYISEWRSEKHAKIEIDKMVRPIMEAFRMILFNMILQDQNRKISIELTPKPIVASCAICYTCRCKSIVNQFDILAILQYPIHSLIKMENGRSQQCTSCQCGFDKHMIADYELSYQILELSKPTAPITHADMNWWLDLCLEFACFIGSGDPFICYFDRFIQEEQVFVRLDQGMNKSEYAGNIRMHADLVNRLLPWYL